MEPRNYLANAGATPPAAPPAPSQGYPQTAIPGTTPATTPGPFWYYKIGEELRAVINGAGIVPSDADLTQLLTALEALYLNQSEGDARYAKLAGLATQAFEVADAATANQAVALGQFVNSFAARGYAKLPGGLIVQWGQDATANNAWATATLPIAFPNAGLIVVASTTTATTSNHANAAFASASQIYLSNSATAGAFADIVYWIAIGH